MYVEEKKLRFDSVVPFTKKHVNFQMTKGFPGTQAGLPN